MSAINLKKKDIDFMKDRLKAQQLNVQNLE
jgi:hypothetical protein